MVEMGTDRIHHGFWKYMDAEHRKHEPGNRFENAILDYHVHVDGLIGGLLAHADDETVVLVVSDHGAKRMDGGIRINEWLRREGLPRARREPDGVTTLARRRHRLVAHDRVGRGRLLRARLPQRRGPRAGGHRRRRRTTSACATSSPRGSRRSRTRTASRSGRSVFKPEELYDEVERRRARPDRPLRRPALARRSARSAATRASTRSRTTPAPTTRTTPRTGC